jgi:hypothetical protein
MEIEHHGLLSLDSACEENSTFLVWENLTPGQTQCWRGRARKGGNADR